MAVGLILPCTRPGVHRIKPIEELTEDDWDTVQSVNLKSAFFLAKESIIAMKERGGGSILLVSSCSAKLAYPGLTVYCASKVGMEGMVRGLACDGGTANVRVNAIAPGTTKTPMTQHLWSDAKLNAAHEATFPLNRLASVDDIAKTAMFLASDLATYVTGAVIPVYGGMTAMQQDFVDLNLRPW